MRGLNNIPLFVNNPWVQVFLLFGGGFLLYLAAFWMRDHVWHRFPLWAGPAAAAALVVALFAEGAFEEWGDADRRASALEQRLQPTFSVACDEPYRISADRKWSWMVFRVHNTGMEAARGCYVKIVSFICTFSVTPIDVRPANATKLKWSNTEESTCVIPSNSHEFVNIAYRHVDTPQQWALNTQVGPENFPLPPGTFELAIEACGENATGQTTKWQISYKPDELFTVKQID